MKSFTLRISLVASLLVLFCLVSALPTRSDSGKAQFNRHSSAPAGRSARAGVKPLSYRSPGATHKLMLPGEDTGLEQQVLTSSAVHKIKRYGAYSLVEVSDGELGSMDRATLERATLRDDLNLVLLKRGQIDTTGPEPAISNDLRLAESSSRALHLVQLFGPPTPESVETLTRTGATIVSYIPNNAYLMWTTRSQRQRLHSLRQGADGASLVQWDGPFHPAYKLDPHIKPDSVEQIAASVAIVETPQSDATVELVKALANKVLIPEFHAAGALRIKILAESYKLKELAKVPDVLAIEPWVPMRLMDERADQIAAGQLTFTTTNNILVSQPTGPGYLAFLNAAGFNSDFDFSVDVGDTGFDSGSADPAKLHADFLDGAGASRIAYLHDFTADSHPDPTILPTHDGLGHGTINASLMGGLNNKSGAAFVDAQGFHYGLGVAPFARIGVSKLFPDGNRSSSFSYTEFIRAAYQSGARISNNSWGACDANFCDLYSEDTQIFDALVRDADATTSGNQSMTILFAAGNNGDLNAPTVSIPGTAKNVITVGLSENVRGTETDGCGVRGTDADNAQDVVFFSAFGPVQDGRAKPDLVAPGSHMSGAASQDKLYSGAGVCNRYFPVGQTLYTWSSGTSHSTPVVSGAAALTYQWLRNRLGADPSPALVKAFILNSTSYLGGSFGGGDLPAAHQGWGLLNLDRMFQSTGRVLLDESPSRTFTQSGGAPVETSGVIDDPSKEFRVMLAWSDPPGSSVTNAPYVNQLNLEVVVGGVVYNGNQFSGQYSKQGNQKDFLNNVQGVRLPAGTTGPFTIRVQPTLIAGDGVPGNGNPLDQDFALVVTNGHEAAIPILTVDAAGDVAAGVTVQHSSGTSDASLIPGESAKLTITVKNQSSATAANITNALLSIGTDNPGSSTFSTIAAGGSGVNGAPFQIQVPSTARCGSVATLSLKLDTNAGRFTLPVRVQVGRPIVNVAAPPPILFDDADANRVKWRMKAGWEISSAQARSATSSFHIQDPGLDTGDSRLGQLFNKKPLTIPENAGQVRLSFYHIYNFEPGYDGGALEISTDTGETWQDLGSRVLVGGYDGTVTEFSSNPLGTRFTWTARGRAGVFSQVIVDLSDFAGKTIKLRFLAGFDDGTGVKDGYTGWFIDDILITANYYSCGQSQAEADVREFSVIDRQPRRPRQSRLSVE